MVYSDKDGTITIKANSTIHMFENIVRLKVREEDLTHRLWTRRVYINFGRFVSVLVDRFARASKSDENHCASHWMSRVVAKDNRQSLIVSGLTTLYAVCKTQQTEGAPLFIESKAKFACTTDRELS